MNDGENAGFDLSEPAFFFFKLHSINFIIMFLLAVQTHRKVFRPTLRVGGKITLPSLGRRLLLQGGSVKTLVSVE